MPSVKLKEDHVTYEDINQIIKYFREISEKKADPVLIISAAKKMAEFDLVLIGYLILFKEQNEEISITLEFPLNPEGEAGEENGRFEYKLKQYCTYAHLITGKQVFELVMGDTWINVSVGNSNRFSKNWFVLSESFMLLLLISPGQSLLYERLFEKDLNSLSGFPLPGGIAGIPWVNDCTELYGRYKDWLIGGASPQDREGCILRLAQLAYYKSLSEAKILHFFLLTEEEIMTEEKKQKFFAGNLSSHRTDDGGMSYDALEYYHAVRPVFLELKERPMIYHFVFSTFVSSGILPSKLTHSNSEEFKKKLWNLWSFTIDIVHGLTELAKNIQEHTQLGTGIITAQVIHATPGSKVARCCFGKLLDSFVAGLGEAGGKCNDFVHIQVFDLDETGMIPTLLNSTNKLYSNLKDSNPLKELIRQDVVLLGNRVITLAELLQPDKAGQLNQQSKRSIGHYGLLAFSKLILSNKGMLEVSTANSFESTRDVVTLPEIVAPGHVSIAAGTCFNIFLPVNPELFNETFFPHPLNFPVESSINEVQGIEELFSFSVVDSDHTLSMDGKEGKFMINYRPADDHLKDRGSEYRLWCSVMDEVEKIPSTFQKKENLIFHVDLRGVKMNDSQLLRFIGNWELENPRICLVVSNVEVQVLLDMVDINEAFTTRNGKLGFWNETMPLIVYSYVKRHDGSYFHFADVFWGRTKIDFEHMNRMVSRNHFNSTTMLNPPSTPAEGVGEGNWAGLVSCSAFFNRKLLLPFDLLIEGRNGNILFEDNAAFLLQNEINIDSEK